MKRDISIYFKDMVENMELAEKFVEGMSYDSFVKDKKTHYSVIRCIEIMGEAAKHVPDSIRESHPEIPWKDIAGMRDKVIHFYFGVNLERVWLVIHITYYLSLLSPQISYVMDTPFFKSH